MVRFVFVLGLKWGPQTHSEVPPWPRFVPRFWQLQLYHWAILLSQLFPVIFYYPVWVSNITSIFTFSHHLSMVGLLAFLLTVHRLCGFVEGRLSHFLQHWLRTGWQSVISQGKNPLKYSAVAGNRTRATGRTDSELFHWPVMTDYCIYISVIYARIMLVNGRYMGYIEMGVMTLCSGEFMTLGC